MNDIINALIAVGIFCVIAGILALAIGFCAKVFHVEEDPRVDTIIDMLPKVNCGACGYPGCLGLANAIVFDKVSPNKCKPGSPEMYEQIKKYILEHTGPNGEYLKGEH